MKKIWKRILLGIGLLLIALTAGFFVYASDYYRADASALALAGSLPAPAADGHYVVAPGTPGDAALIFYPGGKVEHLAYLPLLEKITQETGITCILADMPFRLAVFDSNAAERIMAQHPEIKTWYVGGHSLGAAMASSYASANPGKVRGLILMGAYRYGEYPLERTLTIYGTLDTGVAEKITYTRNVVPIEGGNHAQFGSYGKQKGDQDALIPAGDQKEQAARAVRMFLSGLK